MHFGRSEVLLVTGLLLGLAVSFSAQTVQILQGLRAFERDHGLGLVPGLAIVAATVVVYLHGKRRERQFGSAGDAAEPQRARERARELERVVTFWHLLTQALNLEATLEVAEQYLPDLAGSDRVWIAAGSDGDLRGLFGPAAIDVDGASVPVTEVARQALAGSAPVMRPDGFLHAGQWCFPLVAGGETLGVLGRPAGTKREDTARRLVIGSAAALLAVALKGLQHIDRVKESSLRDSLTGCVTRTHALEVAAAELVRSQRSGAPVAMILFDVDRFKQTNDRHGHLCGDAVLAEVGARMHAALRRTDLKCRYGGDEFLVLLPETTLAGAGRVAEVLRRELASISVSWDGSTVSVSGSFGVAASLPGEQDPSALIARADAALYRAKREGRDSVRLAAEAPGADAVQ